MAKYKVISLNNFTGGWNLRDDEVGPTESPDCYNVSINQAGAIEKRLGFTKWNASGQPAAIVKAGYYSQLLNRQIWQAGTGVYTQNGNGTLGSANHTWSTSATGAYVDFAGFVYGIHPVDGVIRTADGTTWNAVGAGPDGTTLAVWQNKLFASGDPAQTNRVYWSNAGDGATWTGTDRVDLRSKDTAPVKALHTASREGLLAFKEESTYRIYDSTTGANQLLDWNYGAANHHAVATMNGVTVAICKHGVFATDGMSELEELSDKINNLFKENQLAFGQTDLWRAGYKDPKVYFSLTGTGATANNLVLEYDARFQCWVPHSCAAAAYAMYSPSDGEKLLGSAPSVNGQIYELYDDIGTDDGSAIASRYQTSLLQPENMANCRFRRLVVRGRGAFNLYTKLDGSRDFDDLYEVDMSNTGIGIWDSSLWDGPDVFGPGNVMGSEILFSLGTGRDICFEIQETGSSFASAQQVLDSLGSTSIGYWGVYGLRLEYVDLGGRA